MIIVAGHFRLPKDRIDEARKVMEQIVGASLAEEGCLTYSYAEDVTEPGLFRVFETWETRAALDAHFATPHMQEWVAARAKLGFADRRIRAFEVDEGEVL